jgi:hypothetical protein
MYRYCLVVAMLLFVEPGQVVESAADAEIIRPACLFEDRNHAFALYLGVAIAVRDRIDAREIVERQARSGCSRPKMASLTARPRSAPCIGSSVR